MKILITGADNFIGSAVFKALSQVTGAVPVACSSLSLAQPLPECDAVVHCWGSKPQDIMESARALFESASQRQSPPLIVLLSSMTVYGAADGLVDEDTPLHADIGAYGAARIEAEQLAQRYPRSIILRPGVEYGPGAKAWGERVERWLSARRIGDLGALGDGYCNLVHVDDLAQAVVLALQTPAALGLAFNLAMNNPPRWNEYFIGLGLSLGAVPVRRVTRRRLSLEMRLLAPPLKILELVLGRLTGGRWLPPPAIPPSFRSVAMQEIVLDNGRAKRVLGWQPRALDFTQSAPPGR